MGPTRHYSTPYGWNIQEVHLPDRPRNLYSEPSFLLEPFFPLVVLPGSVLFVQIAHVSCGDSSNRLLGSGRIENSAVPSAALPSAPRVGKKSGEKCSTRTGRDAVSTRIIGTQDRGPTANRVAPSWLDSQRTSMGRAPWATSSTGLPTALGAAESFPRRPIGGSR